MKENKTLVRRKGNKKNEREKRAIGVALKFLKIADGREACSMREEILE